MPTNRLIALNVTRTRVTVLMFNLTVITFLFSFLAANPVPGHPLAHLSTSVALFVGFCLTLLGLLLLLSSQQLDEQGLSRVWPFTLGAMTTYLALSQTITAFMHEYLLSVTGELGVSRPTGLEGAGVLAGLEALGDTPLLMLTGMGAILWGLITYVGPLLACLRSPVDGARRWLLAGYYVALQGPIYWVYARAWHLEYASANHPMDMPSLFALQFAQPLLWFR